MDHSQDRLTLGVEEEFLLVDAVSRQPGPASEAVLAAVRPLPGTEFQRELLDSQVEAASGVCTSVAGLGRRLFEARRVLSHAARENGAILLSTGSPVVSGDRVNVSRGARFARIAEMYAGVVTDYQACGCHVHVGVPDRDAAVAVVNHLRPWLPTLVALSANSPYNEVGDSGYASWRTIQQTAFPGAGVPPWTADAAAYDRTLDELVECGVLVDPAMSFWLARPSPHLPTVEFRAADAAATVDDALLQAALSRALVATALADLSAGREAPLIPDHVCAAALWSAARYGLTGPGVHPFDARRVPALQLVDELVDRVRPALRAAGDLEDVETTLTTLRRTGGGADRQRRAAADHGEPAVLDLLAAQTMTPARWSGAIVP